MSTDFDMQYFTNHLNNAYIFCKSGKTTSFFANKTAIQNYGNEEGIIDVSELLSMNTTHSFLVGELREQLKEKGHISYSEVGMVSKNGAETLSDVEIAYTNEKKTEFCVIISHQKDRRLAIAKSQVDTSHRAEAILEFDENLTIYHCNHLFYNLLGARSDGNLELIQRQLSSTFRKDKRIPQQKEIRRGLQRNKVYHTEVEIVNLCGDKSWYSMDLQRRSLDSGVEKLMCSMVDIDENVQTNKKLSSLSQYFDSMQSLSGESMYVIDVDTRILKQKGKVAEELGIPPEVYNYPESAYNLMHPSDLDNFKVFANNSLSGEQSSCQVRVMNAVGEYQWYEIFSMVIRGESGEIKEILGKMNNIDKEHQMEVENSLFLQQFAAMQELTDNILYQVDVKKGILYHNLDLPHLTELGKAIPNYVDTFVEMKIIHPDDEEKYRTFLEDWYAGRAEEDTCTIRARIISEEYQKYSIRGKKIFDQNGVLTHVLGALVNVQKELEMESEFNLLSQYFNVMQELSDDILYRIDTKSMTLIHSMDTAYLSKYGKAIPDYINFFIKDNIIHPDDQEFYLKAQEEWLRDARDETTVRATLTSDVYEWYTFTGKKIFDEDGNLTEIFGTVRNVQKQKDLERRATHDLMTNVLNKVTFEQEVEEAFQLSNDGQKHALVFIDLDDFKGVNDTLGHTFGDSLLISVGKRLKRALRENDLVGRLGGDEFAVLIKSIGNENAALNRTNVLLESLRREFSFEGKTRQIKASLGIALFPEHGETYKELIAKSDLALYSSKAKGKNVATVYTESLEEY